MEEMLSLLLNIGTLGYMGRQMNKSHIVALNECALCTIATYDEFERVFKKTYWRTDRHYPGCLIGPSHKEIDLSIFTPSLIKINGLGYLLSSYGFFKANRLRKRTIKQLKQYQNR